MTAIAVTPSNQAASFLHSYYLDSWHCECVKYDNYQVNAHIKNVAEYPQSVDISEFDGVPSENQAKLILCGITTVWELLQHCGYPAGRALVSEVSGICQWSLLKSVHRADMTRIQDLDSKGIALLEYIGIESVPELAERSAKEVYPKLRLANVRRGFKSQAPSLAELRQWIDIAGTLPRKVYY